ncbi:PLAC8-domain-containing protein [Lactarius vividus]|nr:PLAC8-domain-containing protein [Lactarius vividus]
MPAHISSQPQATAPMAAGGNKNVLNREVGVDGRRDWSFDLFDCTSKCGLCCFAYWCPCVVYSKNKQRLHQLQGRGTPLPGGGDAVDVNCCLHCCLLVPGCSWIVQTGGRSDVRARYNVRGNTVGDCCAVWCCPSCSLTQEGREIELEENSFKGFSESK